MLLQRFKLGAKSRIKIKLFIKLFPGYATFFLSLFIINFLYSIFSKSVIGMFFLFIGFVSLRYTYNDSITYHNKSTKKCIGLSILLFAFSSIALISINTKISLIFSVPISIAMTWFLHEMGIKDKLYEELNKKKEFDLDNCTEEELCQRCKERFKRDVEYKTERAIKHFILKLPHEEIDVNPEQSKKERYRMRKLLK